MTDYIKNGEYITEDIEFNQLVSHERIQHLVKKIEYYGYSGEKVKGLMFCSSKQEAHELSDQLNQLGYRTKALTGEDSQPIREQTVKNLEEGKLDYILTVDIFNEGIDIPSINQVVMLRNTQSSIIFIQQLGRGLRKHASKEFVTIIDCIGNYRNNYLIPIALFGDQSMNKDNYRREMVNRNQLEGITTINFEKIAQKQIFDSINQTSLSSLKILREKFFELENRLGRIPLLKDFLLTNSVNPVTFFEGNILHYGQFLQKVKKENSYSNNSEADGLLTFISKELLEGKRKHELIFLKMLMEIKNFSLSEFRNQLIDLDLPSDETTIKSVTNVLTLKFFREQMQKKYGGEIVEINGDQISYTHTILQALKDPITRALVLDGIETGLLLSNEYDAKLPLTVGKKYSRKDFCRLLNWKQDDSATIYGYKTKNHTTPIFVTYHKSEDISQRTQYGDRFINEEIFHWYTRSNRTLQSNEVKEIIDHHEIGNELHLFIKKEDGEGTDFYYLGQVDYVPNSALDTKMPQTDQPVVTMNLQLRQPISYELLHYFTEQ